MHALTGLWGPGTTRAPPAGLLLLLLCLLAATRPSSGDPADSAFTSLPVRDEMMSKYSNLPLEIHNLSLTAEHVNTPLEKNITLEKPSKVELTCHLVISGDANAANVTWKRGDELLQNNYIVNVTGNTLHTQYTLTLINNKQMGDYSCFVGEEKEPRGTFKIKVPQLHGKHKPLITYVGDSTVLMCKCEGCHPLNWTWYRMNESTQVPIDTHLDDKYVVNGTYANETKLRIKQLLEDDKGIYSCHAVFQLGESEDHIELVVLSFLVPLKPFLAIVAEVFILVAVILLCEIYSKKKKQGPDDGKEFEQVEQLKSDDSNGIENKAPRLRKTESVDQ
ncbi:embigin [Perognathus longimembris pacificus]|uniref:embigin n=1 Tax=Perognathus longimembris pacificus TaxID=214514 RepID=UPI002018A1D9|nr:embigin [Perognathus longimembris pacificus]